MGTVWQQTRSEIRRLPLVLARVLGGLLAAVGVAAACQPNRDPSSSLAAPMLPLLLSFCGLAVFVCSSRALKARIENARAETDTGGAAGRTSVLAWSILLLLAGGFLAITVILTN